MQPSTTASSRKRLIILFLQTSLLLILLVAAFCWWVISSSTLRTLCSDSLAPPDHLNPNRYLAAILAATKLAEARTKTALCLPYLATEGYSVDYGALASVLRISRENLHVLPWDHIFCRMTPRSSLKCPTDVENIPLELRSLVRKSPSVLLVSGFYDIGRGHWSSPRPNAVYVEYFLDLVRSGVDIAVFCEQNIADTIQHGDLGAHPRLSIFPFNVSDTFLASSWIEAERKVMASPSFQQLVGSRVSLPEFSDPAYNMVQHSKVSLLRRAHQLLPHYSHYAWVDFGYVRSASDAPNAIAPLSWAAVRDWRIHFAAFPAMPSPSAIPDPQTVAKEKRYNEMVQ